MQVKDTVDYRTLVERAEKAVAAVKDPELKRIAFQKILESLISNGGEEVKEAPQRTRVSRAAASKPANKGRGGPAAYLSELVEEGFFKKPKTIAAVKAELENRGHHIPLTSLSGPLQKKCQDRVLRRQKINAPGKNGTFAYSNW
jgi:phage protein D